MSDVLGGSEGLEAPPMAILEMHASLAPHRSGLSIAEHCGFLREVQFVLCGGRDGEGRLVDIEGGLLFGGLDHFLNSSESELSLNKMAR